MGFTYEESEFINSFAGDVSGVPEKHTFIERLVDSESENEDPELTGIANSTIAKLRLMDNHTFYKMLSNLPVDTYTVY